MFNQTWRARRPSISSQESLLKMVRSEITLSCSLRETCNREKWNWGRKIFPRQCCKFSWCKIVSHFSRGSWKFTNIVTEFLLKIFRYLRKTSNDQTVNDEASFLTIYLTEGRTNCFEARNQRQIRIIEKRRKDKKKETHSRTTMEQNTRLFCKSNGLGKIPRN